MARAAATASSVIRPSAGRLLSTSVAGGVRTAVFMRFSWYWIWVWIVWNAECILFGRMSTPFGVCRGRCDSVDPDFGGLDGGAPLEALVLDEGIQLGRAHEERLDAAFQQLATQLGLLQRALDVLGKLLGDGRRRAARREDRIPGHHVEAGHA